jgi:hypothetical protein
MKFVIAALLAIFTLSLFTSCGSTPATTRQNGAPSTSQTGSAELRKKQVAEKRQELEAARRLREEQAAQARREKEEKAALDRGAKKMIGKRVKWSSNVEIPSDDCIVILFQQICHSVTYRFKFTGTVNSFDSDDKTFRVKLSSAKLTGQDFVSPMYWEYKSRAIAWGSRQKGTTRWVSAEQLRK